MKKNLKNCTFHIFASLLFLSFGHNWGDSPGDDFDYQVKFYIVNERDSVAPINFQNRSRITRLPVRSTTEDIKLKDSIPYFLRLQNFEELDIISYNGLPFGTEVINSPSISRIHFYPPERDEIIDALIRRLQRNKKIDKRIIIAGKIVAYEMVETDSPRPFNW